MIPENINTALADKPEVLEFVKGLDAKADKLTPELEEFIPRLGELKPLIPKLPELQQHSAALTKIIAATQAKDADALLVDFNALKSANADLVRQKAAWVAGGKGTDSPEYKALEEQIQAIKDASEARIKALEDENKSSKDKEALAVTEKRETNLKSAVITAAAKHKIRNPEDEFLLLKAKGLVGHKEDGTPFYYKLNEKNEKVDAGSADALLKLIAETDKSKVDPSGKGGAGGDHRGSGDGGATVPASAAEARRGFLAR